MLVAELFRLSLCKGIRLTKENLKGSPSSYLCLNRGEDACQLTDVPLQCFRIVVRL